MHFLILVHFFVNGVSGSLMGSDRQGNREVTPSVTKLCQRDGLDGFRPLLNLFSNVLTFPQPPPHPFFSQCLEVAETYISLSVFLIVVFLLIIYLVFSETVKHCLHLSFPETFL